MKKIAFIFPGQGSQSVGMGRDIWEKFDEAKRVFNKADEALGFSLSGMCFEGPEDELRKTFNTQPAILTVSVALYEILKKHGIEPDIAAGHSLGEYSALVAARAISFEDAVRLVRARGEFMQEAVPVGVGAMAAILGLDAENIKRVCAVITDANADGIVQAVNFNCPGQVVIAGNKVAVEKAIEQCKASGAKKAVLLPVSAPFHSALMQPVSEKLKKALDLLKLNDAQIPVISNVNGRCMEDADDIKKMLVKQAASPVLWEQCVEEIVDNEVNVCVEVGPGKVLSGFMKKINKEITCLNVEDSVSLDKALSILREEE